MTKHSKVFTPMDFMPSIKKPKNKVETPEQILGNIKILNAAFGGEEVIHGR